MPYFYIFRLILLFSSHIFQNSFEHIDFYAKISLILDTYLSKKLHTQQTLLGMAHTQVNEEIRTSGALIARFLIDDVGNQIHNVNFSLWREKTIVSTQDQAVSDHHPINLHCYFNGHIRLSIRDFFQCYSGAQNKGNKLFHKIGKSAVSL